MLRHNTLDPDRAMILVIDLQEKILTPIERNQRIVHNTCKLLEGMRSFDLPILITEQYPKGLGPSVAPIINVTKSRRVTIFEKPSFSACGTDLIRQAILALDRPQIIIAGIETHVCIQQTALDLHAMDYDVFVCVDAVGARSRIDHETALGRLRQVGINVTTVESVLFELCQRCDTGNFRSMLEVIKTYPPTT